MPYVRYTGNGLEALVAGLTATAVFLVTNLLNGTLF